MPSFRKNRIPAATGAKGIQWALVWRCCVIFRFALETDPRYTLWLQHFGRVAVLAVPLASTAFKVFRGRWWCHRAHVDESVVVVSRRHGDDMKFD